MNELIKFEDITTVGKVFAESGMFADVKTAAQAVVKIMAGSEMGIPAFASMSGIHIIQGKPTVGAGLLAARVKGSGKYNYTVEKHDDKICTLDFFEGSTKIGTSTFTIEDAKKAGTKNLDKYPKNMLFARAMSNGVKWFTPDLFGGPVYVPGEIQPVEEVQDVQHEDVITDEPLAVSHAIATLHLCETMDDLQNWKKTTPEVIVKNKAVTAAATAKFKEVKNDK